MTTDGAIPKDAPVTGNDAPAGTTDLNDPAVRLDRNAAMELMRARRRETVIEDMDPADAERFAATAAPASDAAKKDEDADPGDAQAAAARAELESKAEVDTDATRQVEAQQGEETVLSDEDLARLRVRRKVNGKEEVVPVADVLRSAQKIDAADAYLARAKQTLAETNQLAETLRTSMASAPQGTATPTTSETSTSPTGEDDTLIDDAIAALFQGDEAQAKQKLKEAVKRGQTGPLNVEQVAAQVRRQLTSETLDEALQGFRATYPDIANDAALRAKADEFLLAELNGRSIEQIPAARIPALLEAAGKKTMEWWRPGGGTAQKRTDLSSERNARKQALDELPAASTRAGTSSPPPRTTTDVIAEMAARRNPMGNPRAA